MRVKVGATSYVFRYALSEESSAPGLPELLERARSAGLQRFQVCENARPLAVDVRGWAELARRSEDLGLEIGLGCMTLDPVTVRDYLDRVEAIGAVTLRIVLERDGARPPSSDQIRMFLDRIEPDLESRGIRLAIENHFDIPSRVLLEAAAGRAPERIGFCVDVANSLRNFEDCNTVVDLLGDRAFCYHLKDYRIAGSNVGFSVIGAPFGEGVLDVRHVFQRIFAHTRNPEIYLETWTPSTGDLATDAAMDGEWLGRSIANFRNAVAEWSEGAG